MISSDVIRGHLDAIILRLIIEKDRYATKCQRKSENELIILLG